MSKQLAELCTLLVEDIYGELPGRIFAVLVQYSRLNVDQIRARTFLPSKVVKSGLAVLVQHSLTYYFAPRPYVPTSFQANCEQAYEIVRSGKYADIVQRRLGDDAVKSFEWFRIVGRMSVEGILKAQDDEVKAQCVALEKREADENLRAEKLASKQDQENGDTTMTNGVDSANGVHDQGSGEPRPVFTEQDKNKLKASIKDLVDRGILCPYRFIDTLSDLDATALVEETIRKHNPRTYARTMGPKALEQFHSEVRDTLSRIKAHKLELDDPMALRYQRPGDQGDDAADGSGRTVGRPVNSKKRARDDDDDDVSQPPSKRRKQEEPPVSETDRKIFKRRLIEDAVYRINPVKLHAALRNEVLLDFCLRRQGENAARVYAVILDLIERETPFCFDRYDKDAPTEGDIYLQSLPRVQAKQVAAAMDAESLDRLKLVSRDDEDREKRKSRDGTNGASQSPELRPQDLRPPANGTHAPRPVGTPTPGQIAQVLRYMDLLANSRHELLTRVSVSNDRGSSGYKVNFHRIVRNLIQFEIENMVLQRFGPRAVRMIRILDSKGRLDEKQIAQFGFVLLKTMRSDLSKMQDAGFINTQEVPRDNSRNPSRTIYLWYYNQDSCRQAIIDDAYKAMARIMQRARADREAIHFVMEKSLRSDVKGREQEFMTESERKLLDDFHDKERSVMVQLGRQDSIITLFRDFLPFRDDRPVKANLA